MARPRILPNVHDDGMLDAICAGLAEGKNIKAACAGDAMPSYQDVYKEMARNADFANVIAHARVAQQDFIADEIIDMADEATVENWNVVKLRIWARQWRAAKLAPKKYGDKIAHEHAGPNSGPILSVGVATSDPVEAAKIYQRMIRGNEG